MTELEKRAKDYANKWLEHVKDLELQHKTDEKPKYIRIQQAYKDGATQETALLSQHILDLQKDKGNLTDKVRELEQQIEKMKSDVIECFGSEYNVLVAKLLNKWEIKENEHRRT